MNSRLLLPKSHLKDAAVSASIQSSTVHSMASDDFVSPDDVLCQLDDLHSYIETRQVSQDGYKLPKPSGWKIMVLVLTVPEISAGGLIVIDFRSKPGNVHPFVI